VREWKHLDLNFKIVARIDPAKCIGCDLCYVACWDGAHQCIHHDGSTEAPAVREARSRQSIAVTPIAKLDVLNGVMPAAALRTPHVDDEECVGCNLCSLVCPVESCITMVQVATGKQKESWEQRTAGRVYSTPGKE
jgi:dihydropyrimidine dehydrogenase (NAD+) subunit PreA